MSIWIVGYTEARINGSWHCIDFFQHDAKGQLHLVPCITGQSYAKHALEWDCGMQYLMGVPDELSEMVRKECTGADGVLYGAEEMKWHDWYVIEGSWFERVDFSIPEFCGFFPRQEISKLLSHPDDFDLAVEHMISVEEYQKLDAEAKKAYQYYEYTDTAGSRAIIQEFYQAVMDRFRAYNRDVSWREEALRIKLEDVRVLILES